MPSSSAELIRFIKAVGENPNVEAKGPMEWDGGEVSAGLAKDIPITAEFDLPIPEPPVHRLSVDQYHQMLDAGIWRTGSLLNCSKAGWWKR